MQTLKREFLEMVLSLGGGLALGFVAMVFVVAGDCAGPAVAAAGMPEYVTTPQAQMEVDYWDVNQPGDALPPAEENNIAVKVMILAAVGAIFVAGSLLAENIRLR